VGISTGLEFLNSITAQELRLDEVISNEVLFKDGVCTGEVIINVEEDSKAQVLKTVLKKYNIKNGNIITFGDGLADVKMFKLSTFSVAIFPKKEEVRESADFIVENEPIDQVIDKISELKL
jgi:phosphoserine phosphatase